MCGRFMLVADEGDVRVRFNVGVYDELFRPRYNCAPGQELAVVSSHESDRLQFYRWGFIPPWFKETTKGIKPINARAETLSDKAMFRDALVNRRCLVPANGYFEWSQDKTKQAYLIRLPEQQLFAMAGIWSEWKDAAGNKLRSFAIITVQACSYTSAIHHRMPVILRPEEEARWLRNSANIAGYMDLLKPLEWSIPEVHPVSSKVNSVRNDSPEVLQAP